MGIKTYYELVTQIETSLLPGETKDYLFSFSGRLLCHVQTTEDPEEADLPQDVDVEALQKDPFVGYIEGCVIRAQRAYEDDIDLWWVSHEFDAWEEIPYWFVEKFYEPDTGHLRNSILTQFVPRHTDLIGIETLGLHPQHRGRKRGLWMVKRMVEFFGTGCGLLALNPTPPQAYLKGDTPSLFEEHSEKDPDQARTKLTEYFSSLGFVPALGTPYLARSLEKGLLPIGKEKIIERPLSYQEEKWWN